MPRVRIVTDSSCDLRSALANAHGIDIVPLSIRFGDEEYTDGVDLSVEEFYEKMRSFPGLPETAAPAPGQFEEVFRRASSNGYDSVVCINLSSELSATMQSAQTAAKTLEDGFDVRVIDSRSITMGLGTIVLEAAKAAHEGKDADEIVALVDALRSRTRVVGALDTLENLKKGGRIGGAQAFIGSMLSIKPLVDISTGAVEKAGQQRTRKKSLLWLRDRVLQEGVERLAVMHAEAPDIEEFLSLLSEDINRDEIHVDLLGPVIGTHAGLGTIGCCWLVPS
ncbi:MAG: DegV family protein [Acidimicrobiales bacterium]|nr:DegV family protein [Acidimicrobiales bacterium]